MLACYSSFVSLTPREVTVDISSLSRTLVLNEGQPDEQEVDRCDPVMGDNVTLAYGSVDATLSNLTGSALSIEVGDWDTTGLGRATWSFVEGGFGAVVLPGSPGEVRIEATARCDGSEWPTPEVHTSEAIGTVGVCMESAADVEKYGTCTPPSEPDESFSFPITIHIQ